jgi:hypothetical protein
VFPVKYELGVCIPEDGIQILQRKESFFLMKKRVVMQDTGVKAIM